MAIQWSEEDQAFVVTLPEFGDAKTHGETYEKAAAAGAELIESFLMWYEQDGKTLPEPRLLTPPSGEPRPTNTTRASRTIRV